MRVQVFQGPIKMTSADFKAGRFGYRLNCLKYAIGHINGMVSDSGTLGFVSYGYRYSDPRPIDGNQDKLKLCTEESKSIIKSGSCSDIKPCLEQS